MTSTPASAPVETPLPQAAAVAPGHPISLDRQARLGAGTMSLLGVGLGFFVHPLFYALGLVVGVGLIVAGMTDVCGLSLVMAKMPWNRGQASCGAK